MHDSHEEGYRYARPQACIDELLAALKAARGHADSIRRHSSDDETIVEAQYLSDQLDAAIDRVGE